MNLVGLGFFEVDSESHSTQNIDFYTQNPRTFLICCRLFKAKAFQNPVRSCRTIHYRVQEGQLLCCQYYCRAQIFQSNRRWHSVWLNGVLWIVTCSTVCSHDILTCLHTVLHIFSTHVNGWSWLIDRPAICHHYTIQDCSITLICMVGRFVKRGKSCKISDNSTNWKVFDYMGHLA